MPADLPSGTVTLLFTDIEGSTRMLQELGREAYVRALTEHRRLLREAFTSHGGVEVEMQGDSFHFAFPYARDAVAAAVAGQRALAEHDWESQPIRSGSASTPASRCTPTASTPASTSTAPPGS